MKKYNLLNHPTIKAVAANRWVLLTLRGLMLGGFLLAIIGGVLGTPVGNHNLAIVAVWIAWWAALILIIVPFLGRGWCAVCPIPMPGEWLQHGGMLGPQNETNIGRKNLKRFPKLLRNIWLQNVGFTLLALFEQVIKEMPASLYLTGRRGAVPQPVHERSKKLHSPAFGGSVQQPLL